MGDSSAAVRGEFAATWRGFRERDERFALGTSGRTVKVKSRCVTLRNSGRGWSFTQGGGREDERGQATVEGGVERTISQPVQAFRESWSNCPRFISPSGLRRGPVRRRPSELQVRNSA